MTVSFAEKCLHVLCGTLKELDRRVYYVGCNHKCNSTRPWGQQLMELRARLCKMSSKRMTNQRSQKSTYTKGDPMYVHRKAGGHNKRASLRIKKQEQTSNKKKEKEKGTFMRFGQDERGERNTMKVSE